MTEDERLAQISALKKRFAVELLKTPGNSFAAASKLFSSREEAYNCSLYWPYDSEVLAYKEEVNLEEIMPTRNQYAQKIDRWTEETDEWGRYVFEGKDRIAAAKLYSDLRGWTKEDGAVSPERATVNLSVNFFQPKGKTIDAEASFDSPADDIVNSLPVALNFVAPKERS